jgi:hypothetical protein
MVDAHTRVMITDPDSWDAGLDAMDEAREARGRERFVEPEKKSPISSHMHLGEYTVGDVVHTLSGDRLVSKIVPYRNSDRRAMEVFWPAFGTIPLEFSRGWYSETLKKGDQTFNEAPASQVGDRDYHIYAKIYRKNRRKLVERGRE